MKLSRVLPLIALLCAGLLGAVQPAWGQDALAPAGCAPGQVDRDPAPLPDLLAAEGSQAVFVFDAGGQKGGKHAICVYFDGRLVRTLSPEQFLTAEEIAHLPRCRCLLGHRFWRQLFEGTFVQGDTLMLVRPGGQSAVQVDGRTGVVRQVRALTTRLNSDGSVAESQWLVDFSAPHDCRTHRLVTEGEPTHELEQGLEVELPDGSVIVDWTPRGFLPLRASPQPSPRQAEAR